MQFRLRGTKTNSMNQISTNNLLLQLAYGELSEQDATTLMEKISQDSDLLKEWETILAAKEELNFSVKKPSETSLKIIMEHSRKTEHIPH